MVNLTRLNGKSKMVIISAQRFSRNAFRQKRYSPGHLLLGLISDESLRTYRLLNRKSKNDAFQVIKESLPIGEATTRKSFAHPDTEVVIDAANRIAEEDGAAETEPDHLLIALIDGGHVNDTIEALGWKPSDLREATKNKMSLGA
jgi:ATP-dependent Clp protease ATP-binding subunit ClpA